MYYVCLWSLSNFKFLVILYTGGWWRLNEWIVLKIKKFSIYNKKIVNIVEESEEERAQVIGYKLRHVGFFFSSSFSLFDSTELNGPSWAASVSFSKRFSSGVDQLRHPACSFLHCSPINTRVAPGMSLFISGRFRQIRNWEDFSEWGLLTSRPTSLVIFYDK